MPPGMYWHEFQTITLGFTRQSGGQSVKTPWSCHFWGFEGESLQQQAFTSSPDGVILIYKSGDYAEPRVAVPVFSLSQLNGLTFLRKGRRKTAAWQMCTVVISSVRALFVTSEPLNRART